MLQARTFDQLFDFARTSAATFFNAAGQLVLTPASRNLLTFTQQVDNAAWAKTNAQIVPNINPAVAALGAELRATGTLAMVGSATPATFNSSTGVGTASRVDASNQSGVSFAVANAAGVYAVNITNTGATGAFVRASSLTGQTFIVPAGTTQTIYVSGIATATPALTITAQLNGETASFTINSVREVIGGAAAAPDNTFTADTMLPLAGTNAPQIAQTVATVNATAYTASWFVRPGAHGFVQIAVNGQTADWCNFTLAGAGTVQNNGAAVGAITFDSATGFYRISMAYTAGGTYGRPILAIVPSGTATRLQTAAWAGTESVLVWGAQFEVGALTAYTRNAGGLFPARFDFDPATLQPRGILIEEQRTNLLLNSLIDGTALSTQNVTVTAVAHTISFYGNGTITLSGAHSATIVGTGAFPTRTTLTFIPSAGTLTVTVSGSVNRAQLEVGDFATSFIPTAGAQVTRTADTLSITGQNFASFWNQNEGTLVAEFASFAANATATSKVIYSANDGSTNERIQAAIATTGQAQLFVADGGVAQANIVSAGLTGTTTAKLAGAYKLDDYAASLNGAAAGTDTLATVPTPNRLELGNLTSGIFLNGHIRRVQYFRTRRSDADLAALSSL